MDQLQFQKEIIELKNIISHLEAKNKNLNDSVSLKEVQSKAFESLKIDYQKLVEQNDTFKKQINDLQNSKKSASSENVPPDLDFQTSDAAFVFENVN